MSVVCTYLISGIAISGISPISGIAISGIISGIIVDIIFGIIFGIVCGIVFGMADPVIMSRIKSNVSLYVVQGYAIVRLPKPIGIISPEGGSVPIVTRVSLFRVFTVRRTVSASES